MRVAQIQAAILVCVLGAGCTGLTLGEVDALHDSIEVRTVLHQDQFTLWSPLDVETSCAWADLIASELIAVEQVFGREQLAHQRLQVLIERVQVPSYPIPKAGESITVSIYPRGSRNGVVGHASKDVVTIFLAPPNRFTLSDGSVVTSESDPAEFAKVLRHELAHVAARRAGLDLPTWLSEGQANLVESLEPGPAGLIDGGPPASALGLAQAMGPDEWRLGPMLAWREDGRRVTEGLEAVDLPRRQLCELYVRWLLELEGRGAVVTELAQRLTVLAGTPERELLAGEAAWLAWLADQIQTLPAAQASP